MPVSSVDVIRLIAMKDDVERHRPFVMLISTVDVAWYAENKSLEIVHTFSRQNGSRCPVSSSWHRHRGAIGSVARNVSRACSWPASSPSLTSSAPSDVDPATCCCCCHCCRYQLVMTSSIQARVSLNSFNLQLDVYVAYRSFLCSDQCRHHHCLYDRNDVSTSAPNIDV